MTLSISVSFSECRRLIRRLAGLGRMLVANLIFAALCVAKVDAAEQRRSDRVESALTEAEALATAGKWREALSAGDRLRVACRDLRGENHPDTALAELFLGEVRDHLGERNLAETHFRRALAIQEQVLPHDAPELVTTLTRLAAELKPQQQLDEAARLLERALAIQERHYGDDRATADACTNLARVLGGKGDAARAVALLERTARILREQAGGHAPETLTSLQELALAQEAAGDFAAAELTSAEWVIGAAAEHGAASAESVAALSEWGHAAESQGHLEIAEERYRRALEQAGKVFANDAPNLARSVAQLGWCLRNLQRPAEAKPLLERALALRLGSLGEANVETAASHRMLGWSLRDVGDFSGALPHFSQTLATREKALGPNHAATLQSLAELGEVQALAGNLDAAAALQEQRRYRAEEVFGAVSEETAAAAHAQALVYESARRWTQAVDAAQRSLRLVEQLHGAADARTLDELLLLSRICTAAGALEPALVQYARLATWFAQHPDASPGMRASLQRAYAIAALRAGQSDAAEALFRDSRRLHEAAFGPQHADTLRSIDDLWTYYDETRQPARALEVAQELATLTESALGTASPAAAEVWERLGKLQLTLGDREASMTAFRHALESRRRRSPPEPAECLAASARMAGCLEEVRDFGRAAELRTERLAEVRRTLPFHSAEEVAACGDLGFDYFRLRDFLPARGMFEHQRELAAERAGADAPEALAATARLGDIALAAGDFTAALQERVQLAAGCARRFGEAHPEHGRALLLLGETQLSAADFTAAKRSFDAADVILRAARADDPLLSRTAADRAVTALRLDQELEARRWTRDALQGSLPQDEAMAEAMTRLGDAWLAKGDLAAEESALAAALTILTQVVGDHDEQSLALLQRVGRLRLESGRSGAAALFARALAGREALDGREAPGVSELLGWLALAQLQESHADEARANAEERLTRLESAGNADPALLAEARALRAWATFCATGESAALAQVREFAQQRWALVALLSGAVGW